MQEVGELIGVSRERVRQIEKKLLKKFSSKYRISEKLEKKLDDIRNENILETLPELAELYEKN